MKRFPDPGLALAVFLALAPAVAVLQFRAIAPLGLVAMAAAAALGPRPHLTRVRAPVWLALALMFWGAASALWSIDAGRSLFEGLRMAGLVLLAGAAGLALAAAPPRPLARWLLGGLLFGAALAFADEASGNAIRAAARGLREWDVTLGFGLKPAATVLALLLPLALAKPGAWAWGEAARQAVGTPARAEATRPATPTRAEAATPDAAATTARAEPATPAATATSARRPAPALAWRAAALVAALVAIFAMPAQAAKIGVLAGLAAFLLVRAAGPWAARAIAVAAGLLLLLAPALLAAVLARGPDVSALQPSASHRVLIWDFTLARIAERPWLGWGMEASRAIPGGRDLIPAEALARFGLTGQREWFEAVRAQRLPLHTHNAPLQVWLELGGIGAALAAALVLALGWRATSPGAAGTFAAAVAIGCLSYGIWQGWWLCLLAMLALTARQLSRAGEAFR